MNKVHRALEKKVIEWLQFGEFPGHEIPIDYPQLALTVITERRSAYDKLELNLAEQSEIIRDLRKHLKTVIEENPRRFDCQGCQTDGEISHDSICQAQHCLSYTSGYQEEEK